MLRKLGNLFLKGYSYSHRNEYCQGHPKISTLELTNLCQMNCKICPRPKMTREVGMMDFPLFQETINQLRSYVNGYICLHGFGDSLLHSSIGKFISSLTLQRD